jgi:ribosomal protein S12 methylthiotransferase
MVNTCAFIAAAQEEAVAAIFELKSRMRPGARLAVLGCLPALHGGELARELPEADLVMPAGGYAAFPGRLRELFAGAPGDPDAAGGGGGPGAAAGAGAAPGTGSGAVRSAGGGSVAPGSPAPPSAARTPDAPFESWERAREGTPRFRSFLKIAEGCGRRCTYCLIPSIRGPLAPVPLDALVREAGSLSASGALELTLVAQDLTAWRDGGKDLGHLCRALSEIGGIRWIRPMYLHPEALGRSLVLELRDNPKVVPYLDVPFQHASPRILRAMGRGRTRPLEVVDMIRRAWPEAAVRTTLMTGFPGETEEDFRLLASFVEEARLDHIGFFKFSPEEGTPAARMGGAVSRGTAERRRRALSALQRRVSRELNRARVGSVAEILVEGPSEDAPEVACGRGAFQAPDADGLVYFDGEQPEAGSMVLARILKAGDYDLTAELVGSGRGDGGAGEARGSRGGGNRVKIGGAGRAGGAGKAGGPGKAGCPGRAGTGPGSGGPVPKGTGKDSAPAAARGRDASRTAGGAG